MKLLIIFLLIPLMSLGWPATVTRVVDGDTIKVKNRDGLELTLRLEGIDCPEKKQKYGICSMACLEFMVQAVDMKIEVIHSDVDGFGRVIAKIYAGGIDINKLMITRGLAWHYKQYSDDEDYAKAEIIARKTKDGLWAYDNPIAPWEYRASKKRK